MRTIGMSLLILALVFFAFSVLAAQPVTAVTQHRVEVSAEYPQLGDEAVDEMVRVWLEEHVSETMAAFSGVAVHPDMDEESADTILVRYSTTDASPQTTSFIFLTSVFPYKAAHPLGRVDVLNFDVKNTCWLTFADIFDEPDKALAIMSANVKQKISEYYRRMDEDQFPDGLTEVDEDWFSGGSQPTPENYAAFALVPEGVRVIFQQYQILPYAFGMPEATYTLEELAAAEPNLALWGEEGEPASDNQ